MSGNESPMEEERLNELKVHTAEIDSRITSIDAFARDVDSRVEEIRSRLEKEFAQRSRELACARARIETLESMVVEAEAKAFGARATISFRLGAVILGLRSVRAFIALPRQLLELRRETKRRRTQKGAHARIRSAQREDRKRWREAGVDVSCRAVIDDEGSIFEKNKRLIDLLSLVSKESIADAERVYGHLVEASLSRLDWLKVARIMERAGQIGSALQALDRLDESDLTVEELRMRRKLDNLRELSKGVAIPLRNRIKSQADGADRRVLYCTNAALPHTVSGYTVRTHALVKAVSRHFETIPVVRSGAPRDKVDVSAADSLVYDGVVYRHLQGKPQSWGPIETYIDTQANQIAALVKDSKAGIVHAPSNYLNALPALIGARRAGVPFVYEVRGLWELSECAVRPAFDQSEQFDLSQTLETRVALEADRVLCIGSGIAQKLMERGVPEEKIGVLPNGVDLEMFRPGPVCSEQRSKFGLDNRFVIGFFGSCMSYEGLPFLADLLDRLVVAGHDDVRLLVCGKGPGVDALDMRLRERGRRDMLVHVESVPFGEMASAIRMADVVAIPRLDTEVCRIVPAIKTLEAMACGRPVLVTDLHAQRDYIEHGKTGFLLPREEIEIWVREIVALKTNDGKRVKIGMSAAEAAQRSYGWDKVATSLGSEWQSLFSSS